jgi:uncharacterized membrane protein YbhN (UPF0104 family)
VKRWRSALQWGAGVALLAVLCWHLDATAIGNRLLAADPALLASGLVSLVAANALSALRWRSIAADMGCTRPAEGFLVRYAQGVCLNTVLPGATVGGDVWRSAWLVSPSFSLARAGLTVILDRVAGMWMLATIAVAGTLLSTAQVPAVLSAGHALLMLGPMALWLPWVARLATGIGVPSWSNPLWRHASVQSAGVQALSCAALWCSCRAVGVSPDLPATLVLAGGLFIAAALPASVLGFGSREAAAAWLFPVFAIDADAGVAASMVYGLLGTLQGVLYLPLWWRRH